MIRRKLSCEVVYASQEPGRQPAFAPQEANRLGVLADVDQVRAEAGLPVRLAVIQPDQRPAQIDRRQRAKESVPDGDTE